MSSSIESEEKNHLENFSLADFFSSVGSTLHERVEPFATYYRESLKQGLANYGREVVSPPGPRVLVRDTLSDQAKPMIMFGSNDYLGLTTHPHVKECVIKTVEQCGVGMGGPPLLNGTSLIHRRLENRLANFKRGEAALLFASGFQANLGWVTALLRTDDVLLYDELSHASFYDGIKLARTANRIKAFRFKHSNVQHLSDLLRKAHAERKPETQIIVAVEGVYSMDGDLAPLVEIDQLCRQYSASLFVDDAHGTGVMGENGRGTAEHFGVSASVSIAMGTFSKAFGVTGGFVVGEQSLIDYLRFFSRSYMFSAHLPQSMAAAVLAGLEVLETDPGLVAQLHRNRRWMVEGLNRLGYRVSSESAIIPVSIPSRVDIRRLNRRFHEEGLFVNTIEFPAVSVDEQRIRVSLMATHTQNDIEIGLDVFHRLGKEFQIIF